MTKKNLVPGSAVDLAARRSITLVRPEQLSPNPNNPRTGGFPLTILDWDIYHIEGATLETWLPLVFARLEELALICRARNGSVGAFIEDKNSGTILLQQALRRGMRAHAIDTKLTAMGKDERALSVSGYVYKGQVK